MVKCYICKKPIDLKDVKINDGRILCEKHSQKSEEQEITKLEYDSIEMYKYVRMHDGRVSIQKVSALGISHKQMARNLNGTPLSAGIIWIGNDSFKLTDEYSLSLGIGSELDDDDYLSVMLGIPFKDKQ